MASCAYYFSATTILYNVFRRNFPVFIALTNGTMFYSKSNLAAYTVIRFLWVSTKFGTCTVVSVNGTLFEAKMCTFTLESTHFIFNQCSIYTHDGASSQFSTNSHETDYSVPTKITNQVTLPGSQAITQLWSLLYGILTIYFFVETKAKCRHVDIFDLALRTVAPSLWFNYDPPPLPCVNKYAVVAEGGINNTTEQKGGQ